MSGELTICAKCRFYTPGYSGSGYYRIPSTPAWCSANDHEVVDVVTGGTRQTGTVMCYDKNDGHCPDYEYGPKDPGKIEIIDVPRKHWWQR